jgi:hypothetical protein
MDHWIIRLLDTIQYRMDKTINMRLLDIEWNLYTNSFSKPTIPIVPRGFPNGLRRRWMPTEMPWTPHSSTKRPRRSSSLWRWPRTELTERDAGGAHG